MDLQQRNQPAVLASDVERDEALVRLHKAFAEGRLTTAELDERMDAVLASRTRPDLDRLLADLPADLPADRAACHPAVAQPSAGGPRPAAGRWLVGYKSEVRRAGRWRLPRFFNVVVYKGGGVVDLRLADFDAAVTRLRVLAYKSDLKVLVPPGVRVESGGLGVCGELGDVPAPDAPVLRVQGLAYKGAIEIDSRPR